MFLLLSHFLSSAQIIISTPAELLERVGYICNNASLAPDGREIIPPSNPAPSGSTLMVINDIDLDVMINAAPACNNGGIPSLPIIIPGGIKLEGTYDLLNNPDGTMLFSNTHRAVYDGENSAPDEDARSRMALIVMSPGEIGLPGNAITSISHIRLRGPSHNWTEFNVGGNDPYYVEGIQIWQPCFFNTPLVNCTTTYGYNYHIAHCEIFGFNRSGIFAYKYTDNIEIDHCYIHHVKGISEKGIGYGTYVFGRPDPNGSLQWNLNVHHNIFDENKDAFDADLSPYNMKFENNTLLNFAGGINRHNSKTDACDKFTHAANFNGCKFYHREDGSPNSPSPLPCSNFDECMPIVNGTAFEIDDITQGNSIFNNNIFYKEGLSTNYPGPSNGAGITTYQISIDNNTFAQDYTIPDDKSCGVSTVGKELKKGYATIADNYVENCIWDNDPFTHNNNSFSYLPSKKNSSLFSPQPPEVRLHLNSTNSGLRLSESTTPSPNTEHSLTQYISEGAAFDVVAENNPILGSQNISYLVRLNTSTNPASGNNSSGNNYYFYDQTISPPSGSGYIQSQVSYPEPGLYGIDAIAIASDAGTSNQTWEPYNSSPWKYIPIIVAPTNGSVKERYLSFNIKDSYQEFHNLIVNGGNATGIYKQVELNGTPIWWEDISDGGDGWERVVVDLGGTIINTSQSILSLFKTDGTKNTITFSVAIRDVNVAIPTNMMKGLLVWIDDVYLKKNKSVDNLILDGGAEFSTANGLPISPTDKSGWYQKNIVSFNNCGPLTQRLSSGSQQEVYPDGSPVFFNAACPGPSTQAIFSNRDRKSGRQSVQLTIPGFNSITCPEYLDAICSPTNEPIYIPFISAAVDIDFTDFLTCSEYISIGKFDLLPEFGTLSPNHNYYVPQNLNITGDLILNRNIIAVASNVSIDIQPNSKLQILETNTLNQPNTPRTIIFGCDDMWEGINVQTDGKLFIEGKENNKTEITDAKIAINSHGYNSGSNYIFKVQNTLFDQNNTAIQLNGIYKGPGNTNFYINGCTFSCSTGAIAKPFSYGLIPESHVKLVNVTGLSNIPSDPIQIGNTSPTFPNLFSGAYTGISSTNSRFIVRNATFNGPDIPFKKAFTGIYSTGLNTSNNYVTDVLANSSSSYSSFNNLTYGIYTSGIEKSAIDGNSFENCNYAITNNFGFIIDITNNKINHYTTGIGVYNNRVTGVVINPHENSVVGNLLNSGLSLASLKREAITGIDVQNTIGTSIGMLLTKNQIFSSRIGIHTRNYPNIKIGKDATSFNTITDQKPVPNLIFDFPERYGIWVENCNFATINNNNVEWTGGTINDPGYLRTHKGIALARSGQCSVKENIVTNYGAGFNIFEDCTNSNFQCNGMHNCFHGFYFDDKSANNKLTDQGVWTGNANTSVSWNNWWDANVGDHISGIPASGLFFRWMHVGTNDDPNPQPFLSTVLETKQVNQLIPGCTPLLMNLSESLRNAAFGAAAADTSETEFDSLEYAYNDLETFYYQSKSNPLILNLGTASDVLYQNKFQDIDQSEIGKFDQIKTLLQNNETQLALQVLNSLSPQSVIDANKKTIGLLIAENYDPFADSDSDSISLVSTIAYMHPFYGGEAVYMARAILHLNIQDELPALRRQHLQHQIPQKKSLENNYTFIPNPASSNVQLLSKDKFQNKTYLEIYSATSELIAKFKVDENSNSFEFTTDALQAGIYFCKILNGKTEFYEKLIIIR